MTDRENFFHVIRGGKPERIPFYLTMCDNLLDSFEKKYATRDINSYYKIPFAHAGIKSSQNSIDYSSFFSKGEIDYYDDWGVGYKSGSVAHFTKFVSPMSNFTSPEEVRAFPMEDYLAGYRWEGFSDKVARLKEQDKVVLSGGMAIDIFEPSWYLRGMENLLCDFITNPDIAEACLERTLRLKCEIAARFAAYGVDVIIFGDDVGTERGMMMNPDTWRQWLKPRLTKTIKSAKEVNPNVLCYYHSDGDIRLIIDELIECGVDILNPIQPECMNPVEIYGTYHDRVALWGTIGTQTTMPFGSVGEVTSKTREMIELCKMGGKLVIAPTHILEPEVPLDNVDAFINTVRNP